MIETKELRQYEYEKFGKDYLTFGWQATQEVRRGLRIKHTYQILARDTGINNYTKLKSLEYEYEKIKDSIKPNVEIDGFIGFLLLLLFLLPGIIYFVYMNKKKKAVNEFNHNCYTEMTRIVNEANNYL